MAAYLRRRRCSADQVPLQEGDLSSASVANASQRPKLLLLDEVMAGLTATEVAEAIAMIRRVREKHRLTILLVEHVLAAMMTLCGRIVVLHHGGKIAEGAPQAIAREPSVLEAYLGSAR